MINWNYCPQCKNKLDSSGEYPYCKHCDLPIYLNSKPTASILPIDKDKVLLCKRGVEPHIGEWDTIGGFLKNGESPIDGIIRETKEETGLEIKIFDILGIYMDRYGPTGDHTLNINYIGEISGGKMSPQDDISELKWFPLNKLPKPAFKNQIQAFKDLQKWYLSRG